MKATAHLHRPTPGVQNGASDFPTEPPSVTSLPTPIVPASPELLSLGGKVSAPTHKTATTGTSGARKIGLSSLVMNKVVPPAAAPAIPPPAPSSPPATSTLAEPAAAPPEPAAALPVAPPPDPVVAALGPLVALPEPIFAAPESVAGSEPVVEVVTVSSPPSSRPGFGADEQLFWSKAPSTAPASLPPSLPPPPRPRSLARRAGAKVLFFVLFGAVAALLGYAIQQRSGEAGPHSFNVIPP